MGTRKNNKSKKTNKRFRKTRSKKQRGGGIEGLNKYNADAYLIQGAKKCCLYTIKEALKAGANINENRDSMNDHGIYEHGTALAFASEKGCYKIVEYLLERGANVNILGDYTALILASSNGHTKIVEKLLSQPGIDVNIKGYFGYTALMLASEMGHTEIVEMLLEKRANVNAKAKNGWTALMKASRYPVGQQHEEIMKLLIRNGATIPYDREDLLKIKEQIDREEEKFNARLVASMGRTEIDGPRLFRHGDGSVEMGREIAKFFGVEKEKRERTRENPENNYKLT